MCDLYLLVYYKKITTTGSPEVLTHLTQVLTEKRGAATTGHYKLVV